MTEEKKEVIPQPPILGEFSNWVGVNNSENQVIIDFGFIQPTQEGEPKTGIIIKRMILPPAVAKELGRILTISFDKTKKDEAKG
ncbi:MAG: DUF3467 domain-containing protein [bacterium]